MMRDALAKEVHEEFEDMLRPQVEKAKKGDTTAFLALIDRVGLKPVQQTEVTNVKTYRLDDAVLEKTADELIKLQKANPGGPS